MKKRATRKKKKAHRSRRAFIRNERRASMAISARRQLGLGLGEK